MDNIEYIGFIAGFCTTIAFIPQLINIINTRSTKDISLLMYIIFCTGLVLWIIYGCLNYSYPIIIANTITLLLAVIIITMKLKWK
jgi:MtN3 and saliva related transmembrane protein